VRWRGPRASQFAQALERFRAIDAPFEEARTLLARGRYRRTQGQRDSGSQDLAAARRIFERRELGARPWSEQASAALVETETSLLARLTPAERDVAIAVAAGRTDEQVAEQLGIKRSTVRWHLSKSIYPKVGVHRRGELIALVLRELGDPP
jgi:DNA-binding CsgD family transcriptional regulator